MALMTQRRTRRVTNVPPRRGLAHPHSKPAVSYWALEAAHAHPEQRFLIFLDEFNRCREMARNGIMPALDATRKLYNPLTGTTLDIPDNVLCVLSASLHERSQGT